MRSPFGTAARRLSAGLLLCGASGCHLPPRGASGISSDRVLIFEQRVAASGPGAETPWESWQLYESGRFVYVRAGAAPTQKRIPLGRLQAVHGWLYAHDAELQRAPAPNALAPPASGIAAMCQVHTSSGLMLAPIGDARYGVCDELKKLAIPE